MQGNATEAAVPRDYDPDRLAGVMTMQDNQLKSPKQPSDSV
jgi:hypothetical protein